MRAKKSSGRLTQFLLDESGQDLIEYGLLAALIGTVGILAWSGIKSGVGTAYLNWGTGVQGLAACTPDPGATTCP
jgi:Flp pilus assembly pilin Flp